jgi:hypothetical protein
MFFGMPPVAAGSEPCRHYVQRQLRTSGDANPILSYLILSHPILSYPILSYPILSYPILSYPILSYTVRYSFATPLLEGGYDIRTVRKLLGRLDAKTTMITYVLNRGYGDMARGHRGGVISATGKFPHQISANVTKPGISFKPCCKTSHLLSPTPRSMWRHPNP